ncbi:MAG: glycosyltransferase family 2 protein [Selenomonadaceae bacterium]|nr:glycosyltransferase family 2 protein [Selenomonadaceae bacterium]
MTSIIILSYNTIELTKLCLQSIRHFTESGSYELILVDNASTDGSGEWLAAQPDVRLIANRENVGFPKGCNQGMEVACGEDILLLNSDTVVTPRWLEQLKRALYSSPKVGAVGPVTNKCARMQQLTVNYGNNLDDMLTMAENFNHVNPAKWELTFKLVAFCFLFKREIYEKIGGLDERFAPGNFEDDDYSLRLRLAGFQLLLLRDTFIHHFGSSSFVQQKSREEWLRAAEAYNALLTRNERFFLEKWKLSSNMLNYNLWLDDLSLPTATPKILLWENEYLNSPYQLRRLYPQGEIEVMTDSAGYARAMAPDFPVRLITADYREDFWLQGKEGYYDCAIYRKDLLKVPEREDLLQVIRRAIKPQGSYIYEEGDRVRAFTV